MAGDLLIYDMKRQVKIYFGRPVAFVKAVLKSNIHPANILRHSTLNTLFLSTVENDLLKYK